MYVLDLCARAIGQAEATITKDPTFGLLNIYLQYRYPKKKTAPLI